jgi:hypothetical protein
MSLVTLVRSATRRFLSLLSKQLRLVSPRERLPTVGDSCLLSVSSICPRDAAEATSCLRLFVPSCLQQSGDLRLFTLSRLADSMLPKQPRACASDSSASTPVVTPVFSHTIGIARPLPPKQPRARPSIVVLAHNSRFDSTSRLLPARSPAAAETASCSLPVFARSRESVTLVS